MENKSEKKPRVLCLHGHGASAEILKKEMELGWPQTVLEKLDLVFLNGPFLLQDKVDSHGIFHPPYYEWFQKGAIVTATMPGMQRERVALTKVPNIKFVIIISGFKFGAPEFGCPKLAANAYSSPIETPSLHFIGEKEAKKTSEEELVKCFVNPVVIHHPEGHKVPNLDAESVETVITFINKVKKIKMPLQGNSKM
ncbi:PREDICTED: uncharacterized protein LOC109238497 isoform X2 [Nicotiana attenuata]|uniref:uncharacterized protein LOC109238497 isoform X2 n=1 Tax=Nicotiana attenuata TaxID=49451 RepID=UPI000904DCA0|nr:PREDICTED: uncharacterized protein LOC109238497 isoform X2 [Nicotiana attenuata]